MPSQFPRRCRNWTQPNISNQSRWCSGDRGRVQSWSVTVEVEVRLRLNKLQQIGKATKRKVQQWQFKYGSTTCQRWFNSNSMSVHHRFNGDSTLAQQQFNGGEPVVTRRFNNSLTSVHCWFNISSTVVQTLPCLVRLVRSCRGNGFMSGSNKRGRGYRNKYRHQTPTNSSEKTS